MEFIPVDMDAKIQECLEVARASEARGEMLDRVLLAGAVALALESWVQVEPDQREALIVKARKDLDAEPHWLVALSRTTDPGSARGHSDDSLTDAIGEALQNWEQLVGPDK